MSYALSCYIGPRFTDAPATYGDKDIGGHETVQWNLSVTATSMVKFIICDLFSSVF